jgi:hypothetical protein
VLPFSRVTPVLHFGLGASVPVFFGLWSSKVTNSFLWFESIVSPLWAYYM